MEQLKGFPYIRVIERWLKAGYIDNDTFNQTLQGTPQGGLCSALLANIALHGMEEELGITYCRYTTKDKKIGYTIQSSHTIVRYADDFVILCRTREEAQSMYIKLKPYLQKRGLELSEDKTRITHISEGFNFLGFNVRKYKKDERYKLLIKPSKESVQKAWDKIREEFKQMKGGNVEALISKLNPIIRGYGYYWHHVVAKRIYYALMGRYAPVKNVAADLYYRLDGSNSWMADLRGKYYFNQSLNISGKLYYDSLNTSNLQILGQAEYMFNEEWVGNAGLFNSNQTTFLVVGAAFEKGVIAVGIDGVFPTTNFSNPMIEVAIDYLIKK